MNYIKLLIAAHQKIVEDQRLNATHVSLYFSLFQQWNNSFFSDTFFINRYELMNASKIGSKGTYHKCLKELHTWGYLKYSPSNNAYKGSTIRMNVFSIYPGQEVPQEDPRLEELASAFGNQQSATGIDDVPIVNSQRTTGEQQVNGESTCSGQAAVPVINNNKQANNNKLPNDRQSILNFFKTNGFGKEEGLKFYEFYQDNNWKTGDGSKIRDWQAVALSWMERTFKKSKKQSGLFDDHLKIKKEKNYEQPL